MIRAARREDAKEAAILIYDAIKDIAEALTGEENPSIILTWLENYFQQDVNRLSYQNCLVAEKNNKVVGIAVLYHGSEADKLDEPIVQHLQEKLGRPIQLDIEAEIHDYYIDTLSVNPEYQRQGIGTDLIKASIEKARELGYPRVSLNVEENNIGANRLYSKLGFLPEKQIMINGHVYHYLVKKIN